MESFQIENGPERIQKPAGRKYLILAIISIVTAVLLFIVVLTIIIIYEENKHLYSFQDQDATLYTSQNDEWSTSQLKPSSSTPTIFSSHVKEKTVSLSEYVTSYSRGFSDSIFLSEYYTRSSHVSEKSLFISSNISSYRIPSSIILSYGIPSSIISSYGIPSSIISSYRISSSMNTPSDEWPSLSSSAVSTEFVSTEIQSTLVSASWIISTITEKTDTFLTSEFITTTTAIVSSSTAVCRLDQYQCKDESCISPLFVCDGTPNCPDASDERQDCECSMDQFRCESGQCVLNSHRCDRYRHCFDETDEVNCSNCVGFVCDTGLCLWTWTSRCNGIVECVDLSDEKQCPFKPGFRRCSNRLWIRAEDWCNGLDDCHDNSDETQCKDCGVSEVMCSDHGRCMRQEWLCDGHFDCSNGTDERNCSNCTSDQFTCRDHTCVDMYDTCDGVFDCPDRSDEERCVQLRGDNSTSGVVVIHFRGDSYYICSTYWTGHLSDSICHLTGHEFSKETLSINTSLQVNASNLLQLRSPVVNLTDSFMQNFDVVASCDTDNIISVTCMPKECGERKVDLVVPYIAGGDLAVMGKWPWVVSLSYLGKPICGGVLITEQWVVTAGHCISIPGSYDYSKVPFYIEGMFGCTRRSRYDVNSIRIKSDRIVTHQNLKWTGLGPIYWDIALVHLERPVQFTSYIQPICLPKDTKDINSNSNCYLAGWGLIGPNQDEAVDDLREAKLKVWNDTECQKDKVPLETSVPVNTTLCAGYKSGILSGCQGDSGSPLMCQDSRGHWTLTGIMSSGPASCGIVSTGADRFTKISAFMDWITNITTVEK